MLQPGADLVAKMGGLHRFMGWDGPMLTDSGGFQIFSLGHGSVADEIKGRRDIARPKTLLKISEKGAAFRSYIDGSKHLLTPEGSIDIQRKLGADLIVTFDECTPYHSDRKYTERSLRLSNRWGDRCIAEFERGHDGRQALYGILQGGVYQDLRHEAADLRERPPVLRQRRRRHARRGQRPDGRGGRPCDGKAEPPRGRRTCSASAASATSSPAWRRASTPSTASARPASRATAPP